MARAPKAKRAKRELTPAQRAALEKAHAARRRATGADEAAGRVVPPAEPPSFLGAAPPPPEARPDTAPDTGKAARGMIEGEIAASFAGVHFLAAWATGIPQLGVEENEAREVARQFVRMMDAWGIDLTTERGGRILATLNFAVLFGSIEISKLAVFRLAMTERAAQAQAARTAETEPAETAPAFGPAPLAGTGIDAMHDPHASIREAAE